MNSKKITVGVILLVSFTVVLILIFMPIFGHGRNGLEFSDDFFNSLSKGSSNYMDAMRKVAKKFDGKTFDVVIKAANEDQVKKVGLLYTEAGAQVEATGVEMKISGDLGKVLLKAIDDSEAMFNNQGDKLKAQYNYDAKEALKNWWTSFTKIDGALKKQKNFKEAKAVTDIQARSIEPGYNFYGIEAGSVGANAGMLIFMLVFYVIYTMWYGYGIFELFEGIGMGMHKTGAKEEV